MQFSYGQLPTVFVFPVVVLVVVGLFVVVVDVAVVDAVVDIWYAGGENPHYTFRPDELVYRGKSRTSQSGDYEFLATFPGVYSGRPIPHYHVQVSTRTTTFITQIYFKNLVPKGFENYVRTRGSQFGRVSFLQTNTAGLRNGGRLVNFDMKINN